MRIKKIINWGMLSWYNTKFSGIANKEMYGPQLGELAFRSWEWKGQLFDSQEWSACNFSLRYQYTFKWTGGENNQ